MFSFTQTALLALVAAYSCEAAFDSYTSIEEISKATPIEVVATRVAKDGTVKSGDIACAVADFEAGSCSNYLNFDNDDYLQYKWTIPAGLQVAGNLTPVSMVIKACFASQSQVDRPWRKSKDPFKKDKRCSPKLKSDPVPFEGDAREYTATFKIASNTPPALFSPRLFIKCEGQGENEWCYTYDAKTPVFATESMESRPTGLWVAVLVCAFIGPALFIIQLIWERVIKKDA